MHVDGRGGSLDEQGADVSGAELADAGAAVGLLQHDFERIPRDMRFQAARRGHDDGWRGQGIALGAATVVHDGVTGGGVPEPEPEPDDEDWE